MEEAGGETVKQLHSAELLEVGSSQGKGLYNKLLLNSKQNNKNGLSSPIVRMPRSSILDRVQSFLPQMASANEKLSKKIGTCPAGTYDIENVEDQEKIIEMDVALVELNSSDSSEEEDSSSYESSDSEPEDEEITENNIRLGQKRKKAKIEVLNSSSELKPS
ncbi:NOP protein chaperone 1-like [Aquarana catesbeiana]|uniref:NOP protein chaperone 1-like n=1 Tax=Aquarana catesbeiana TaxID=8400 RepID=UPI003CC94C97